MLRIELPPGREPERAYAASVVIGEFLGLPFELGFAPRRDVRITAGDGRELLMADRFLSLPDAEWLSERSIPPRPLPRWNAAHLGARTVDPLLPVIAGDDPRDPGFYRETDAGVRLGLDVFGSSFFMLARYEEAAAPREDRFGRFPGEASLAFAEGFLERPIVNEYCEVLWTCLRRLWPGLERKRRTARILVTHDVDEPLLRGFRPFLSHVRSWTSLALRGRPRRAAGDAGLWIAAWWSGPERDPYNTFDELMDLSERHGVPSAFYFMPGPTENPMDVRYRLDHPFLRKLLRRIHARGHEIGLHGSFDAYRDARRLRHEFEALRAACAAEDVRQDAWGGRQHYLRWRCPDTFRTWDEAGLDYDATLGYADRPGFRCGTCYEFPAFDLRERRMLRLRERPLTVMEVSLLGERYLGLSLAGERAANLILALRSRCELFDGDFSILWHNSRLLEPRAFELFERAIAR